MLRLASGGLVAVHRASGAARGAPGALHAAASAWSERIRSERGRARLLRNAAPVAFAVFTPVQRARLESPSDAVASEALEGSAPAEAKPELADAPAPAAPATDSAAEATAQLASVAAQPQPEVALEAAAAAGAPHAATAQSTADILAAAAQSPAALKAKAEAAAAVATATGAVAAAAAVWPPAVRLTPVGLMEPLMAVIHEACGLPWWATIIGTTLMVRVIMLPAFASQIRSNNRLHNIYPEISKYQELTKKYGYSDPEKDPVSFHKGKQAVADMQQLYQREGVSPIKTLGVGITSAAVFMTFFFSLRSLADNPLSGFATGGPESIAVLRNLAAGDPTRILFPGLSGLSFLGVVLAGGEVQTQQSVTQRRIMVGLALLMGPGMAILAPDMPLGVYIYWITSNLFTLLQTRAFQTEAVRKFFDIPERKQHPGMKSGMESLAELFKSKESDEAVAATTGTATPPAPQRIFRPKPRS
eukprot:tig00021532_g22197.t1